MGRFPRNGVELSRCETALYDFNLFPALCERLENAACRNAAIIQGELIVNSPLRCVRL